MLSNILFRSFSATLLFWLQRYNFFRILANFSAKKNSKESHRIKKIRHQTYPTSRKIRALRVSLFFCYYGTLHRQVDGRRIEKKTEVSHPPSPLHTFIYSSAVPLGICSVPAWYLNGIWTGLRAGNTEPIPNWYRHFPTSIHILSHTLTIRRHIYFFCTFFARLHKKVYLCTAKSRMESAFGVRRCLHTDACKQIYRGLSCASPPAKKSL